MAYKTTDKDYYIYAAWVVKIIRYICLLSIATLVILNLTVYKSDITIENMKYLLKNIDFGMVGQPSSEAMQISFRTSGNTQAVYLRGDIALLSRQGYETYDFSGNRVINASHSFSNPAIKTSERYALVYDVGGKELDIYNAFANVYTGDFPLGVFCAAVGNDGAFAVATSESTYKSGVVVYNSGFKEIFRWMSASLSVTSIDMPGSKSEVIAAGVRTENGDFVTEINCFDTAKNTAKFNVTVNDEFPLAVEYTSDGFFLLTDSSISFYERSGKALEKHEFMKGTLCKFFNLGDTVAISVAKGIGDTQILYVYTDKGALCHEEEYIGGILDMSIFGKSVYVLEPGLLHMKKLVVRSGIPCFDDKEVASLAVDSLITRVFASGTDEYILLSSSGAGKFN